MYNIFLHESPIGTGYFVLVRLMTLINTTTCLSALPGWRVLDPLRICVPQLPILARQPNGPRKGPSSNLQHHCTTMATKGKLKTKTYEVDANNIRKHRMYSGKRGGRNRNNDSTSNTNAQTRKNQQRK